VEARIAGSRAIRSHFEGNPTAHRTHSRIAADASERAGDLRYRCVHLMNLGVGGLEVGDWTHAEQALRDAIVTAQDLGLENLVGAARNNLGWTLARAGRLAEGHAELVEGLRILQRHGDKRMIGGARSHLAFVHLERRDFELAEEEGLRAVDVLEAAPPLRAQAFALVARARLRRGDLEGAFEAADAARRQLEALGKLDEGEAMVHLAFVEVLRARGDHGAADAARDIARERILGRAAQIVDPRLRDAFLHDVPEHAQLLGDQL
jgi:tetratricopeptide (TPR) repeat protein